jgi:hypothetical protein
MLFVPNQVTAQPPSTVPAVGATDLRLVGTIISKTISGAVLDVASGTQLFYRLHDKLPDESQIVKVQSKSILVKRTDGELYEMFVTGGKTSAVIPVPSTNTNPVRQYSTPPGSTATETPRPRGRRDRNRRYGRDG